MNRAEFMAKVYALFSPAGAIQVELAYLLSKKIHRGQFRKELGEDGNPLRYFDHTRRTALILIDELGCNDLTALCAALCHDTIEDTEDVQLVSIMLVRLFDTEVAATVRALSKAPKAGYLERLKSGPSQALLVKAADRLDNLRSLPADNPAFCKKQRQETIEVYLPLFTASSDPMVKKLTASIMELVK